MKVDLPAFGMPSRPTTASTLSSRLRFLFSPGQPGVFCRGARLMALLKRMLPKPPSPPLAMVITSPAVSNSNSTSPVSASVMIVPTGIFSVMSSPAAPNMSEPMPCSPRLASCRREKRKSTSVLRFGSATANTWPPRPPSPPLGPPNSLYFSWRNETQPFPPSPAATSMKASSTNFMVLSGGKTKPRQVGALSLPGAGEINSGRDHAHGVLVQRALDREGHVPVDQREQRVVLADADVAAGVELGAALAHDDGTGADQFAAERLDAQHLRLRIAAVAS